MNKMHDKSYGSMKYCKQSRAWRKARKAQSPLEAFCA